MPHAASLSSSVSSASPLSSARPSPASAASRAPSPPSSWRPPTPSPPSCSHCSLSCSICGTGWLHASSCRLPRGSSLAPLGCPWTYYGWSLQPQEGTSSSKAVIHGSRRRWTSTWVVSSDLKSIRRHSAQVSLPCLIWWGWGARSAVCVLSSRWLHGRPGRSLPFKSLQLAHLRLASEGKVLLACN